MEFCLWRSTLFNIKNNYERKRARERVRINEIRCALLMGSTAASNPREIERSSFGFPKEALHMTFEMALSGCECE